MRFLQLKSRARLENPRTRDETVFAEARELAQQRLEQYIADLQAPDSSGEAPRPFEKLRSPQMSPKLLAAEKASSSPNQVRNHSRSS